MYLKSLTLYNFKNYPEISLEFSRKINCFTGNNGVGKTNLLDAIYYLAFTKSYFNLIDSQNIRHDEEAFSISGKLFRQDLGLNDVQCSFKRNEKKQVKLNAKEYNRMADHIGEFPVVMVSPYDRDLINDGSETRRKYFDSVIAQFDRNYLEDLLVYQKALVQRNALLRQFAEKRYFDEHALEIWTMRMEAPARRIYERRKEFLEDFLPVFQKYFRIISGGKEEVHIGYDSNLGEAPLTALLKDSLQKDLAFRYTGTGIHKDDFVFLLDGYPVKKYGSQGQQKSFVTAVKLAQFEYTRMIKGFNPIILFDDIFDKLDGNRVEQIISLVSDESFGQVFITDTQPERINRIFDRQPIDHKIFNISNNEVVTGNG